MKSPDELNRQLKAVKQTRQITNAMYLLSVSRMKKVLSRIEFNRQYMKRIRETVKDLISKSPDVQNWYRGADENVEKRAAFVVIASDKSLCGAYNINVANTAIEKISKFKDPCIFSVGSHITDVLKSRGFLPDVEYRGMSQSISIDFAKRIGSRLVELFLNEDIDEAYIVYTEYLGQMLQSPTCVRLLPLVLDDFKDDVIENEHVADLIYEPSINEVFNSLVPQYIIGFMCGCFCQALASEHVSRMNAMQSATKNADSMIKKLGFEFNAARQIAITSELTEIASVTELLNKSI